MKRFYIAERFSFDLNDETEDKQIANDGLTSLSKNTIISLRQRKSLKN